MWVSVVLKRPTSWPRVRWIAPLPRPTLLSLLALAVLLRVLAQHRALLLRTARLVLRTARAHLSRFFGHKMEEGAVLRPQDALWVELPASSASKGAAALRMSVAVLLNSIWPENGSVTNRFTRLSGPSAPTDHVFALIDAKSSGGFIYRKPAEPQLEDHQSLGTPRVFGSASLRAVREADGPEVVQATRACASPCILFSLLVDAPLQDRGFGAFILRRVEAEAASHGHTHIFLAAEPHIVPFYEKYGYDVVSDASWKQRTRHRMMWMRKCVLGT